MTQSQLNQAVARATGESITTIARLGFNVADPAIVRYDPERRRGRGTTVNWDALDAARLGLFPPRRRR